MLPTDDQMKMLVRNLNTCFYNAGHFSLSAILLHANCLVIADPGSGASITYEVSLTEDKIILDEIKKEKMN